MSPNPTPPSPQLADASPIRVRFPAEPLTPAAEADPVANDECHWAESDAYRVLRQQIQRYARGEISGQSILLAGHRGSGKTTTMHLAIQQVRWFAESKIPDPTFSYSPYLAIPLFVPIHGPDLLSKESGGDGQALAERAMSQIRRALHRALAEELGERFVQQTEGRNPTPDDREAAYQLRVELDKTPQLALLRAYWERAKLVGRGLLSPFRIETIQYYTARLEQHLSKAQSENDPMKLREIESRIASAKATIDRNKATLASQTFKEILALQTATRALEAERADESAEYWRLTSKPAQSLEDELRTLHPRRLREAIAIATPILSLLVGAWAANSVVSSTGPILAGTIGLITAGIIYSFLSRTLIIEPKDMISSDASAAAQDIFLPILVRRVFDAGFAPIFVIDELDKVEGDLSQLLGRLMRRLKYVVTDRAFFCFIADRSYYEQFRKQIDDYGYPLEETYFADRLLIYHTSEELREYLRGGPEARGLPQRKPLLKTDEADGTAPLLIDSIASLILAESNGHLGDLGRVVKTQQNSDGSLSVDPQFWRTPGYRLQIFVQAAIDQVFRDPSVRARLRQEPSFAEWVNDALYYFPKQWTREREFIRYSSAQTPDESGWPSVAEILGRGALGKQFHNPKNQHTSHVVLVEPNSGVIDRTMTKPTGEAHENESKIGRRGGTSLDEREANFLFDCMNKLGGYLEHPGWLARDMLSTEPLPGSADLAVVLTSPNLVKAVDSEKGLSNGGQKRRTYKWQYGQYGDPWSDGSDHSLDPRRRWTRGARGEDLDATPFYRKFSKLCRLDKFIREDLAGTGVNDLFNGLATLGLSRENRPAPKAWAHLDIFIPLPPMSFKKWLEWRDDWTFESFLHYVGAGSDEGTGTHVDRLRAAFSMLQLLDQDKQERDVVALLAIAKTTGVELDKAAAEWRTMPQDQKLIDLLGRETFESLRATKEFSPKLNILRGIQGPHPGEQTR